jgi:tRNA modification GTPase
MPRATVVSGRWRLDGDAAELPGEVYWWPGERSYARQPTVEFHTLGSPPLLDLALAAVCAAGARLARPGEFTLRAFLAGRLDLMQAEAVLGVIDAVGPADLDTALAQLAGGLTGPLRALRERLLNLLAHVEAGLDFVTEDIEFISAAELDRELLAAAEFVTDLAGRMSSRGQTGDDPHIVLAGRPNAGKSSLFNALCGDFAALVADLPGTTRDYIVRRVDWEGVPCQLIDTAGLDAELESARPLEFDTAAANADIDEAAQDHAMNQRLQAAVELFCVDVTRPLDPWELAQLREPLPPGIARLVVLTKIDAAPTGSSGESTVELNHSSTIAAAIPTSSATGEGIGTLRAAIVAALRSRAVAAEGVVAATAIRCRESLRRAAASLEQARHLVPTGQEELIAAEVRMALEDLGEVAGTVYTDDVLDRIFSRFCIGK